MEHTKHTPGPWHINPHFDYSVNSEKKHVAMVNVSVRGKECDIDHLEAQANANLIAAAPDLLTACEAQAKFEQHAVHCDRCGRAEKYCYDGWHLWNTAGNLRNQAIAKAKGEQCSV